VRVGVPLQEPRLRDVAAAAFSALGDDERGVVLGPRSGEGGSLQRCAAGPAVGLPSASDRGDIRGGEK